MRPNALSDFDVMIARLVNWGRWGRQDSDKPDANSGCGSVYQRGRADRRGDDEDEAPDEPHDPIDSRDAEALDSMIRRLDSRHLRAIRDYFYRARAVSRETVATAVRALCDREQCKNTTRIVG